MNVGSSGTRSSPGSGAIGPWRGEERAISRAISRAILRPNEGQVRGSGEHFWLAVYLPQLSFLATMSTNVVAKFDTNVQLVLSKFQEILALLTLHDKALTVHATESLQIESNAHTIVRLVEELLTLTRTLKEKWVLGQVPFDDDNNDERNYELYEKINSLLQEISE